MTYNKYHKSRRRTPWDFKEEGLPVEEFIRSNYLNAFSQHHKRLSDTNEADFLNSYTPKLCPYCESGSFKKNGLYNTNLQRYQCKQCGRSFNILTGTLFEDHKIPITEWIDYILQTISYESNSSISLNGRNSESTTPYWMRKLFLALESYQDDIVLRGNVQIDETFYTVITKEIILKENGKKPRGISKNKYIIGIGIDDQDHRYFKLEGKGKPTIRETEQTFINHIEPGSHLIHDKEHSHRVLIKKLGLTDEAYDSKSLKELDDKDNPLCEVNHMCFLLKKFLQAHSGFNRDDLQGYLDLFSLIMNEPSNKLEKVKIILDRVISNPKLLRYRTFYAKNHD